MAGPVERGGGKTKPAASATLRSSASGHSIMDPNLPDVTMADPLPTACTRPPFCACNHNHSNILQRALSLCNSLAPAACCKGAAMETLISH